MSGKLSTHVLDLVTGRPAAGMKIELRSLGASADVLPETITATTNSDGRTDAPLIAPGNLVEGEYELLFHVGAYFGDAAFLDTVPIRFRVSDATRGYHVPLLCTPWAYSTYRGS